ncbi:hypothetical protein Esti_003917 [Eimeria stiedai]
MGARQRKEKKGPARQGDEATKQQQQQHTAAAAAAAEEGPEEGIQPEQHRLPSRRFRQQLERGPRSAFARTASLSLSEEEEEGFLVSASLLVQQKDLRQFPFSFFLRGEGGGLSTTTAEQERITRGKERKKFKKEQERMRSGRQEGSSSRQKKGGKTPQMSSFFETLTGSDFKSRLASWSLYLLVGGCILGIFVLKALEEYYGLEEDVGGETKLEHLAALGLEDGASESDIRREYRTLSVRWHPDRNANCGASCQQRFQQVAAAYEYLMRKQKRMHADGEEEAEEGSGLKITSQGVVDFSGLGPKDPFPPSTDTKHVWTVMVHQDKDDWSQSVYEMWQEASRTLGKYVKFGVISIRGRSSKDVLKKLPINVKIYPAILLMSAGMHPEQYPNISRPSVESINRFIADAFPSNVEIVHHPSALRSWLAASVSPQTLASQYKAVIIPSGSSSSTPSLLVKHAAFSNKEIFSFCFLANARNVLASQKEELVKVLKNPPTWLTHIPENSRVAKALKLPVHLEDLREESLISNSNVFLFKDEGRGVSRTQVTLLSARSKLLNPSTALSLALDKIRDSMQPLLYQQTSASLCKGALQRHVFCLVAVEPAADKPLGFTETIDLARIKSLLKESKEKYLQENPNKNLEAVWERAVQRAQEHERGRQPKEGEENGDFVAPSKEADDVHIEQPEDIDEEIIHVQVVRVALGVPATLPSLPAFPPDGFFTRFLRQTLNNAPLFLLDLEGSRAAALPPLFVRKDGSEDEGGKSSAEVYRRLYQTLDEMQSFSEEEESSDHQISFKPLPEFCSGQDFVKNCLVSEQRSWWSVLFSGGALMQVVLVAAFAAGAFVCWNKMSAEVSG